MLIFITGYMCAGKTTLGRRLAGLLNYRFIDLDEKIEELTGISISEFFIRYGEDAFRIKEREVLIRHLNDRSTIISTGGGAACYADNMELMNRSGMTVFLDPPVETIISRISADARQRPLFLHVPESGLPSLIMQHLDQRKAYYSRAVISLTGDETDAEILVILSLNDEGRI